MTSQLPQFCHKGKSLKIPKELSESVNRSRTDNTMVKRTNNEQQNITHKSKDRVTCTSLKQDCYAIANVPRLFT